MDHKQTQWHALTSSQVIEKLSSEESRGLSDQEAEKRRAEYGPNTIEQAKHTPWYVMFIRQFHNVLIYVLLGAAGFTLLLEHYMDSIVILAVVLINAIIGMIQEGKAEKAIDAIRGMLAPGSVVMRNGIKKSLPAEQLVPGDIVFLESGDKVPADTRLIKAHNLSAQEAVLTGESMPVDKALDPVAENTPLGDRGSLAFSGTLITKGQGKGIVVATGMQAEIGQISHMLSTVETLTTPLLQQMAVFGRWLTAVILLVAAALLAYGYYIQGQSFSELFMIIVGLSVAAIPEGLPAVLTITLAIGVQAMARRNAIVRRLPIIETIGSVSVICTDKTGTLTKNEMTVSTVATFEQLYDIEGSGYNPEGKIYNQGQPVDLKQDAAFNKLVQAGMLCNDATLNEQDDHWSVRGDPMEGALLVLGRKAGLTEQQQEKDCPRSDIIPFDTAQQYMATLHCAPEQGYIFIKGAPERILGMCPQHYTKTGETQDLESGYWQNKAEEIAKKGQRVLAFAFVPVPRDQTKISAADIDGKALFLGLTGLMDPPRPEALQAIEECHRAGIKVKMITGDHAATAVAIGRMVGLAHPDAVLTGADIDDMDDTALAEAILETDVFARTSPAHKLRLVTALQAHDLVVAMTGDGANDAPALKRADAGIAMGQKGSDAAREAGDLILIDDNFASIVAAIWEGRTVYDNLKKVISWILPTNAGEALTIIVALLSGMLLPVTPIQILWVNLVTAVTLGIALAFEPMEPGTKKRPPRSRNEFLLNKTLIGHIFLVSFLILCAVFGMFKYARIQGYDIELSRTMALNTLVTLEIFYLFYIRNISTINLTWKALSGTRVVWLAVSTVVAAQLIITYTAPLQTVFETRPIPLAEGILIIGAGVLFFIIIETEKQIRLRRQQKKSRTAKGSA